MFFFFRAGRLAESAGETAAGAQRPRTPGSCLNFFSIPPYSNTRRGSRGNRAISGDDGRTLSARRPVVLQIERVSVLAVHAARLAYPPVENVPGSYARVTAVPAGRVLTARRSRRGETAARRWAKIVGQNSFSDDRFPCATFDRPQRSVWVIKYVAVTQPALRPRVCSRHSRLPLFLFRSVLLSFAPVIR